MRAREPDTEGYVERDGIRVWYEVHGNAQTTLIFIPGWALQVAASRHRSPIWPAISA